LRDDSPKADRADFLRMTEMQTRAFAEQKAKEITGTRPVRKSGRLLH
jgi:hypothetical protein